MGRNYKIKCRYIYQQIIRDLMNQRNLQCPTEFLKVLDSLIEEIVNKAMTNCEKKKQHRVYSKYLNNIILITE